MPTPIISDYLKYANLQMAAEAFLVTEDGVSKTGAELTNALVAGNFQSSKFTQLQAEEFAAQWEVVDQRANTSTGFSGTLFRNKANPEELVISFRSTEFIDDHARDNEATNALEVAGKGWAFGQIDDMEAWVAELKTDPDKLGDKAYSVTGYSLGGHLATAFNLLRSEEEGYPGALQRVITFNGDGVGEIKAGTLTDVMDYFRTLRNSPDAVDEAFDDRAVAEAVREIRTRRVHGTWTIAEAKTHIQTYKMPPDQISSNDTTWGKAA
jgi:dienelactone hydrolase